jgi:hypothetical protein
MLRALAVAAALLLLVLAFNPVQGSDILTTTYSGPPAPHQTIRSVKRAEKIADEYWGGTNCHHISYKYADLPASMLAFSSWRSVLPHVFVQCSITFDVAVRSNFSFYCATVVHEFGHLSGHGHSSDPTSIMYPVLSKTNTPEVCK